MADKDVFLLGWSTQKSPKNNKVKYSRDTQISSLQLKMKPICKASALGTDQYLSPVVGVGGGGGGFGAKQGEI